MMMLTQRLSRSASEFLTSGGIRADTAFQLGRDTGAVRATLDGFLNGSDTLGLAAVRDADLRDKLVAIKAKLRRLPEAGRLDPRQPAAIHRRQGRRAVDLFRERGDHASSCPACRRATAATRIRPTGWFWLMVVPSVFTLAVAGRSAA